MSKVSQLKAGAIISYITLIVGNIVPLVYTPFMLSIIGSSEHGLYGTAQSFVSYLSLLSFGLGSAIVRYITKYRALDDRKNEEKTFGLFLMVYAVISIVVLAAGTGISLCVHSIFEKTLQGDEFEKMRILVLLMTVNVVLSLVTTVFSSVIIAHERFIFNKLLILVVTFVTPAVSVVLLLCGFGSVGMTLATTTVNLIQLFGYAIYCFAKLRIKPIFKNPDFGILREILKFSLFIFIAEIANMLYYATDRVLLGKYVTMEVVSVYTIGATFSNYLSSFTTGISGVLMPRVTTMVVKGADKKEIDEIFIKVGRLQFILVSFVLSAFVVFGRQFMPIFTSGDNYGDSYWIALLLMVPLSIPLIESVAVNVIIAQNRHMFRSIVFLCIAVANVIMTYFAINMGYGGVGAAVCSAIAYLIGPVIILNIYYKKKIGLNIPLFWKNIIKLCPTPFLMLVLGLVVTHFVSVEGKLRFLVGAIIFTVVYFFALIPTLNGYEKDLFFAPFRKISKKLKRG